MLPKSPTRITLPLDLPNDCIAWLVMRAEKAGLDIPAIAESILIQQMMIENANEFEDAMMPDLTRHLEAGDTLEMNPMTPADIADLNPPG